MKKITFFFVCFFCFAFAQAQYTAISIVGDGAGGWPGDAGNPGPVDIHQMTSTDGVNWTYENLATTVGSVKFRADNDWTVNWGENAFPTGTGTQDGASIPTVYGTYNVTFNSDSGAYSFESTSEYPIISITGDGLYNMTWGDDIDMYTTDGVTYNAQNVHVVLGSVKFRQDHDWTVNWGEDSFPTGTGTQDGAGIGIPDENVYNVTFNRTSGEYSFTYVTIAFVGAATPGGWPTGAPGETDPAQLTTSDGINYTLDNITLLTDGGKFRQNNAWTVNWGAASFPGGTGTQDGADIPCQAGTYSIAFNRATGEYAFETTAGTAAFARQAFTVYPNPANNNWNIAASEGNIDAVTITDLSGKIVYSAAVNLSKAAINASGLSSGIYIAKITSGKEVQTLKLVKQ